jgi:hypothetical protein
VEQLQSTAKAAPAMPLAALKPQKRPSHLRGQRGNVTMIGCKDRIKRALETGHSKLDKSAG